MRLDGLEVAGDAVLFPIAMASRLWTRGATSFRWKLFAALDPAALFRFSARAFGRLSDPLPAYCFFAIRVRHAAYMQTAGCASKGRWRGMNSR